MSGFFAAVKHLFLPAVIAFALYFLCAYVLIPLYRRHRERYAQYLPLDTISSHTTSLRDRVMRSVTNFILHRAGSSRDIVDARTYGGDVRRGSSTSGDEFYFGEEEGESMVGFDMGRRDRVRDSRRNASSGSERRLSRDLEAGFRDDSGSEDEARDERRSRN